jgi:hypothetical protein
MLEFMLEGIVDEEGPLGMGREGASRWRCGDSGWGWIRGAGHCRGVPCCRGDFLGATFLRR